MSSHLKTFLFGAAGFWAVAAYPALKLGGSPAFVYTLVALGLCATPTLAVAWWSGRAPNRTPGERLLLMLGGTGLRMGLVLAGGLALYALVPYFQQLGFWLWLLAFYIYLLGLEIYLILAEQKAPTALSGRS